MNSSSKQPGGGPRVILVGGFLGAGKTSAIARLGAFLKQTALTVGVITTTSGTTGVDTLRLRHARLNVDEIPAAYLHPQEIDAAARRLGASQILIEAPGASVNLRPVLESLRELGYSVAPLTVLVDPARAGRMLGIDGTSRFSEKVSYLYRKQLEEASLVVVAQPELQSPRRSGNLRNALERQFTEAAVLSLAREEAGLSAWVECLNRPEAAKPRIQVETARYAQAAAALAALNTAVNFSSVKYFDANKLLLDLASIVQTLLQQETIEIAHLKMILISGDSDEIASAHATSNDSAPELQHRLDEPAQLGRMVLNLRAEGDPELLHSAVNRAILAIVDKYADLFARMEESVHFRPEAAAAALEFSARGAHG